MQFALVTLLKRSQVWLVHALSSLACECMGSDVWGITYFYFICYPGKITEAQSSMVCAVLHNLYCGHPHCDVIVPAESAASIACVIYSNLTRVRKQAKFSSDPYQQAI